MFCGRERVKKIMELIRFKIKGEYIELLKLLKVTNLCSSGGEAKAVISEGLVKYNGSVDTRKRLKVRRNDFVEYEGNRINVE